MLAISDHVLSIGLNSAQGASTLDVPPHTKIELSGSKTAFACCLAPPGTIVLTRFTKSAFKPNLPPTYIERKAELVREIKVDTGTIRLDFYDNGMIDGDTISVYVNDMPVVSRKLLSAKPVSTSIKVDFQRTIQEVVMVGENMGTIPPNTALMIINAGDKRYQLYLTSDDRKNALVRFIYEKPVAAN